MATYVMSTGEVLDLSELTSNERAYFDECVKAYRSGESFEDFARQRTFLPANPALAPDGRLTSANVNHPLFRAVLDLEGRLGVRDGFLRLAPGSNVDSDPLDDELVSVVRAAKEKGVTRETVYNAIERGQLVATNERPVRVSATSLRRWEPSRGRQRAGRRSAAARAS